MNKFLLTLTLFLLPLCAEPNWTSKHRFSLKKDEIAKIHFFQKGKEDKPYVFKFRWTLYAGDQVIVLSNYRDFPRQHTLYFKRSLHAFTQTLISDTYRNSLGKTYLLLQMHSFNAKEKKINFDIYIQDRSERFRTVYIDPNKKADDDA